MAALARIGLGANVGEAGATIEAAIDALGSLGVVVARSHRYRTPAWGVVDQPDFENAAVLLETSLAPSPLLRALQALECALGREPTFRWGPRAIDLDILAYGDLRLDEPGLTIPHARLHERAFALVPLAEIDPSYATALAALPAAERTAVQRIPGSRARTRDAVISTELLARVRVASAFCADAELAVVRIDDGDVTIDVRRSGRAARGTAATVAPAQSASFLATVAFNGTIEPDARPRELRAEFVGIVRFSRPVVGEGSLVHEDRELAYVESLGIRNPVRSGGAGRIAAVWVSDGQPVEYGQRLFAIETT